MKTCKLSIWSFKYPELQVGPKSGRQAEVMAEGGLHAELAKLQFID